MLVNDVLLQQRRLVDQIQNSYENAILELVQKIDQLQKENEALRSKAAAPPQSPTVG
jgi:hypothetical protein